MCKPGRSGSFPEVHTEGSWTMRVLISALMAGALVACGRAGRDQGAIDSAQILAAAPMARESLTAAVTSPQELRPAPDVAPAPAPRAASAKPKPKAPTQSAAATPSPATTTAAAPSLAVPVSPPAAKVGTEIGTTTTVEITTRRNRSGEKFTATVAEAVRDSGGREVVPAGATVTFLIVESKEAANQNATGTLTIRPESLAFGGKTYEIKADVTGLQPEKKGRGVTTADAAKVGAGAAAGAILGQVITKKASGTIIGGVVGAAVGTAVAVKSADKDLVIPAGSRIVIQLTSDFVRSQ